MKRNQEILIDILRQFEVADSYETTNPILIGHVALLDDQKYVVARIKNDVNGCPCFAEIVRMTAAGHDALEDESKGSNETSTLTREDESELSRAKDGQTESERLFDKTLYFLSTGGIMLSLLVVKELIRNSQHNIAVEYCLTTALISWSMALMSALVSHWCSSRAFDRFIEMIYKGQRAEGWRNGWAKTVACLNLLNIFLFGVGAVSFLVFMLCNLSVVITK